MSAFMEDFSLNHTSVTAKRRKEKQIERRLSTCTECKYGIFPEHTSVWTSEGLKHDFCIERQDETQTIT